MQSRNPTLNNISSSIPIAFGSKPSMPFTFGNGPSKTVASTISGNFAIPAVAPITQPTNDDSEDDFPICQAPMINPSVKQFSTQCIQQRPQQQSFCNLGSNLGSNIQYGQTKSNQLLYVHLKNMRAQVEQANMMIDSLYQILSQPHILNATQIEQIYTQINTMRDSILANNKSINEIYQIMSTIT